MRHIWKVEGLNLIGGYKSQRFSAKTNCAIVVQRVYYAAFVEVPVVSRPVGMQNPSMCSMSGEPQAGVTNAYTSLGNSQDKPWVQRWYERSSENTRKWNMKA